MQQSGMPPQGQKPLDESGFFSVIWHRFFMKVHQQMIKTDEVETVVNFSSGGSDGGGSNGDLSKKIEELETKLLSLDSQESYLKRIEEIEAFLLFSEKSVIEKLDKLKISNNTIYPKTSLPLSGVSDDQQSLYVTTAAGVAYFEIEKVGGGDITYIFDELAYDLDCTTGAGTGGRAQVDLTEGTATVPVRNYVYITLVSDIATLTASTSIPTGEFAWVGIITLLDDETTETQGPLQVQRATEALKHDNRGQLSYIREKLRWLGAKYLSGIAQTLTITVNAEAADNVVLTTASGVVFQLHRQAFGVYDISSDGLWVANASGAGVLTNYQKITDINSLLETTDGTAIGNLKRFNIVIWGSMNSDANGAAQIKMFVNLPADVYNKDSDALQDVNNYSVTTIPEEFQTTGFLIARISLKYATVASGTWTNLSGGTNVIDLRGLQTGFNLGGSGAPSSSVFSDSVFEVYDDGDSTKIIKLQASGITTGTTRTLAAQDKDYTIADHADLHMQGTDTALGAVGTKNPPVDADKALYRDSEASDVLVTSTWTQIKAFLKTYFDTLYNKYVHPNHSGEVTSVADGATTITDKAVTLAKMADMATASLLGRNTAAVGVPEVLSKTTALSLLNVADGANAYVHPNHSGDVTSVAGGAQTIANDAVTYTKMQNVSATDKLLGRVTAGAGDVEEIACTAAGRALIDDADAAAQRATLGAIANIVEDTTPQLGGDLDTNGKNINAINQTNAIENESKLLQTEDIFSDFVVTGLFPGTSVDLISDISAGHAYVTGTRVNKAATSHTYTASVDTYVDINSVGTYAFPEVALGAGAPAVTADSIRLAKVVTDADNITGVTDLRTLYLATTVNGSEKMRIDEDGNVGIGTTTPAQKLDVSGKIALDGTAVAYRPTDMSGTLVLGDGGTNLSHTDGDDGYYNTFVGIGAGNANTTGYSNIANGYAALYNNTTGYYNTANGYLSLYFNTTGYRNTANGYAALYNNTTGYSNTANGYLSLFSNFTGNFNTAIGYQAGRYIADGETENKTGDYNIFLGVDTKALADNDQNEIVIGYNATGLGSNTVVLGNDNITTTVLTGNVGIGTTEPAFKLDVVGAINSRVYSKIEDFDEEAAGVTLEAGLRADEWIGGGTNYAAANITYTGGIGGTLDILTTAADNDSAWIMGLPIYRIDSNPVIEVRFKLADVATGFIGLGFVEGSFNDKTTYDDDIAIVGIDTDNDHGFGVAQLILITTDAGAAAIIDDLGVALAADTFVKIKLDLTDTEQPKVWVDDAEVASGNITGTVQAGITVMPYAMVQALSAVADTGTIDYIKTWQDR